MKKEFRIVDKKRGITQVTTDDERWYIRETSDPKTKQKYHVYLPSATWIAGYYPKGIAYMKWLADKGWNEAEAIKIDRGKYGSKVHSAIELLTMGETINMDEPIKNPQSGELEPLTVEEYDAILSFVAWWNTHEDIEVVESEHTIWNEKYGFAGTLDLIVKITTTDKKTGEKVVEYWLIDLKTSQYIWPSHEIQVSAYKHSYDMKDLKIAILQLGYKRNKMNYKFTGIKDKFKLFLAARQIWENECENMKPFQKDYPNEVTLNVKKQRSRPSPKVVTK